MATYRTEMHQDMRLLILCELLVGDVFTSHANCCYTLWKSVKALCRA